MGGRVPLSYLIGALGALGAGCAAAALVTALGPPKLWPVTELAGALDRLGLDKGPLFLFGASISALALTLRRAGDASRARAASDQASLLAEQVLDDVTDHGAVLAALQGELGAARSELADLRGEVARAEEQKRQGSGEVGDPMFRLAASLDQLGAQVGKQMEAMREQLAGSISAVERTVGSVEGQLEALEERVRADRAEERDRRALIEELEAAQRSAAAEAAASTREAIEELRAEIVGVNSGGAAGEEAKAIPRELMDGPEPADAEAAPAPDESHEAERGDEPAGPTPWPSGEDVRAPLPSPSAMPTTHLPGFGPEPEPEPEPEPRPQSGARSGPETGESPAPPPPMPAPSEGLELLDDMEKDWARASDLTPPLFPELED